MHVRRKRRSPDDFPSDHVHFDLATSVDPIFLISYGGLGPLTTTQHKILLHLIKHGKLRLVRPSPKPAPAVLVPGAGASLAQVQVLVMVCLSVRPSVRPSVLLSDRLTD